MRYESIVERATEHGYKVFKKTGARKWIKVVCPNRQTLYFRTYTAIAVHIHNENKRIDKLMEDKEL